MQPGCSPCFVEAAQLLWSVDALLGSRRLESIISLRLSSTEEATRLAAFEAFGNLWRFTGMALALLCRLSVPVSGKVDTSLFFVPEDAQLPGVALRSPMFMMLDSLKAEGLSTRRAAEAWMRCSLKSYIRLVPSSLPSSLSCYCTELRSLLALSRLFR